MDEFDNNSVSIYRDAYDKDFDDIGFDPEVIDDSDEEAEELYGIK